MKKLDAGAVSAWVSDYLSDFLDIPRSAVTDTATFAELGLDSADSVVICGAFEERFDVEMDATLFLRNETLAELIDDLRNGGYIE